MRQGASFFGKGALIQRLDGYWKLEAANVVLVPFAIILSTHFLGGQLGWLTWLSFVPMSGLLALGAFYWKAKLDLLRADGTALVAVMRWADRLDILFAVTSALAFLAALASWFWPMLSVSLADRIGASIAATLAVLEYINYYHRQIQHFDHPADWSRLVSGKGFRRSQMSIDLARYRGRS